MAVGLNAFQQHRVHLLGIIERIVVAGAPGEHAAGSRCRERVRDLDVDVRAFFRRQVDQGDRHAAFLHGGRELDMRKPFLNDVRPVFPDRRQTLSVLVSLEEVKDMPGRRLHDPVAFGEENRLEHVDRLGKVRKADAVRVPVKDMQHQGSTQR